MRFIVDECTGPVVARWLQSQGHDAFSVYELARGISDEEIAEKAATQDRIVITNDKGFGERTFREGRRHAGIVLLRLKDERSTCKIEALRRLLESHPARLEGNFVVVTEKAVRISKA